MPSLHTSSSAEEDQEFIRQRVYGLDEARNKNRPILAAFESSHCPPCVLMDRQVLSAEVVKSAVKNFVPVRIDAFNRTDLMERYEVPGTPTFIVVAPDGQAIDQVAGYVPVEEFLLFLKKANAAFGSGAAAGERADSPIGASVPSGARSESGP